MGALLLCTFVLCMRYFALSTIYSFIHFSFYFDYTENSIECMRSHFLLLLSLLLLLLFICCCSWLLLLFLWVSLSDFFSSVCICVTIYTEINEKFKYFSDAFFLQSHFHSNLHFVYVPKGFFSDFFYLKKIKKRINLRALNVNCDWLCKAFRPKVYVWI